MATKKPATYHCPATRWSLDDLVAALLQHGLQPMSRSSIWRMLEEADLKPHRSVYWLNSHDPDFETKARAICQLYSHALRDYHQERVVICADAKTGMQMLQRRYPTQPIQPGKPEKRAHEYIRHGTRALLASLVVPTGQVVWNLGQTRTSGDWARHLAHVVHPLPAMQHDDWVVDNLNTHWRLEVCRLVAQWCAVPFIPQALHRGAQRRAFLGDPTHKHVFHFTPKHGSWLNQVELWFSVLARRFLKRGDFDAAHAFETRLTAARARGRKGGRRPKLSPEQQQLAADMARGGIPVTTIASTLQCSRHTVYKALALAPVAEQAVMAAEEVT